MMLRLKRWFGGQRSVLLLGIVAGALSVIAIGYSLIANRDAVLEVHWHFDLLMLIPALVVRVAGFTLIVVAWHHILKGFGSRTTFRVDTRLYIQTNLSKRLPTPIFLIAQRSMLYIDEGISPITIAAASYLETVYTLSAGIIVLLCLAFTKLIQFINGFTVIGGTILLLLGLFIIHPKVTEIGYRWFAKRLKQPIVPVQFDVVESIGWVLMYSCSWILGGGILYFLLKVIDTGSTLTMPDAVLFWGVSSLFSIVGGILPTGLVMREISLTIMLASVVPVPVSILTSIASRVWLLSIDVGFLMVSSFI